MPWPGGGYATLWYDKLNRLTHVDSPDGDEYYEYAPGGDRIYRKQVSTETSEWYYFYGAYGRLLAVYEEKETGADSISEPILPGEADAPADVAALRGAAGGAGPVGVAAEPWRG